MAKQTQNSDSPKMGGLPRVIADFGGRRKLLDRRLAPLPVDQRERRSGKERRSGFDRRAALNQSDETDPDQRRPTGAI